MTFKKHFAFHVEEYNNIKLIRKYISKTTHHLRILVDLIGQNQIFHDYLKNRFSSFVPLLHD